MGVVLDLDPGMGWASLKPASKNALADKQVCVEFGGHNVQNMPYILVYCTPAEGYGHMKQ